MKKAYAPIALPVALIVSSMIGTGIFSSMGSQLRLVSNPGSIILLWVMGGFISFLGALIYAELGVRFKRSGGEYTIISEAYGPFWGFLAGWITIIAGYVAPVTVTAISFSQYIMPYLPLHTSESVVASIVILAITAVQYFSLNVGKLFQHITTLYKILVVLFFGIALVAAGSYWHVVIPQATPLAVGREIMTPGFWTSFVFVSYAYAGWNSAIYIVGEIENPKKNVPRAFFVGTVLVTLLYILITVGHIVSAPLSEYVGKSEITSIALSKIWGTGVSKLLSPIIALLMLSTLSAFIYIGPRIAQIMGEDYKKVGFMKKTNKDGIPQTAILVHTALSLAILWSSTFDAILTSAGMLLIISPAMAAMAVITMPRVKDLAFNIPCRWLTLSIFLLFNTAVVGFLLATDTKNSLLGIIILIVGSILYYFIREQKNRGSSSEIDSGNSQQS